MKPKHIYFFKVPNSILGNIFVFLLRRYLNRDSYTVRLKGRGKNREYVRDLYGYGYSWTKDMPVPCAEYWGVYIDAKRKTIEQHPGYWNIRAGMR